MSKTWIFAHKKKTYSERFHWNDSQRTESVPQHLYGENDNETAAA